MDNNGTIHYIGNYYEMNLGNGVDTTARETRYYYADLGSITRLIAVHKHGVLYYVLGDHLGSTQRVTDASGNVVDSIGYTVYGETRSGGSNLPMDKRFTGQILDVSTGLYWYSSRAYNPVLCRFVQADTIAPDYNNPQSLNRYSYGYNNPVKYVDPTGHDAEDWFGDSWKAEFREAHEGADPGAGDFAYRFITMLFASGGGEPSTDVEGTPTPTASPGPVLTPAPSPVPTPNPPYTNTVGSPLDIGWDEALAAMDFFGRNVVAESPGSQPSFSELARQGVIAGSQIHPGLGGAAETVALVAEGISIVAAVGYNVWDNRDQIGRIVNDAANLPSAINVAGNRWIGRLERNIVGLYLPYR